MSRNTLISLPRLLKLGGLGLLVVIAAGCAYYNTFYNARTYYRAGVRQEDLNQEAAAKTSFDKAIEKSALVIKQWPRSRWVDDALFLVGMSYYHEASYAKAVRHFDQLVLAFPGSGHVPEAQLYRGLSLLADKQYGAARVVLDEVRQRYPRLGDVAAFYVAKSFLDRDEPEKGVESLAVFTTRYPRSRLYRQALVALADGNLKLKRYAEADSQYSRIVRVASDPRERAQAQLRVAACQYELGQHSEAIRQVEDLLGRFPELDDEANLIMGKSLVESGRATEAVAAWAKVRGPSDLGAEAAFRIARHHEEQAELDAARAYYDTARIRKENSDYGVLAVKRLSLLDAYSQQRSGSREPAEALFLLAEVNNLNLEDYDKALELYGKVHDSFPESEWAAKALFAEAWIVRNVRHDTTSSRPLLRQVIAEYSETEYADESRRLLGLPVPKRKPKAPVVKADTSQAQPDTSASVSVVPDVLPVPPGEEEPEESAIAAGEKKSPSPARPPLPPGRGGPEEEMRRRLGETKGLPPQKPADTGLAAPAVKERPKPPPLSASVPADTPTSPAPTTPPASIAKTGAGQRQVIAHFGTDSARVLPADTASLRALADSMKAHPDRKYTLLGFCDPRASERHNQRLGLRRAQALKDYLVALGVGADRLDAESRGEEQLISSKPGDYWLDRRAELLLR
jgi:TolA-binding protein/outer membrane protein OmpA-like peptidoglycan-associated protein